MTNTSVESVGVLLTFIVLAGVAALLLGADPSLVTGLIQSAVLLVAYAAIGILPIVVLVQAIKE